MRSRTIGKNSYKLTVKVKFYIIKSQRATNLLGYGKIKENHHNTTFKSSQTTFVNVNCYDITAVIFAKPLFTLVC